MRSVAGSLARGRKLRAGMDAGHRKRWAQYITPEDLVHFMAGSAASTCEPAPMMRVLDPGAGVGSLGLAIAERLLTIERRGRTVVRRVELHAVEAEPTARAELELALADAGRLSDGRIIGTAHGVDFLDGFGEGLFDVAIANPPYFKLGPSDTRGGDAPNIYARFMARAAELLRPGGLLCFIVPRSNTRMRLNHDIMELR